MYLRPEISYPFLKSVQLSLERLDFDVPFGKTYFPARINVARGANGWKSRVIEFKILTTDWKESELIRPSGGISLCLNRPAHRPKEEATHKFLGCLFHLAELAGSSSRKAITLTSSGKILNTPFFKKSTGLVPPHSSLVNTYQFF